LRAAYAADVFGDSVGSSGERAQAADDVDGETGDGRKGENARAVGRRGGRGGKHLFSRPGRAAGRR